MSRNAAEIARVLDKAKNAGVPIRVHFPRLTFEAQLLLVDPKGRRLLLSRSAGEAANHALLSRPRCTFHCEMAGWHIEFVAAAPRAVSVTSTPSLASAMAQARPRPLLDAQTMARRPLIPRSTVSLPLCQVMF